MDFNALAKEALQSVPLILAWLTLFFAAWQVRLLSRQINEDYRWRRREKSVAFMRTNLPDLVEAQRVILKAFPDYESRKNILTAAEVEAIVKDHDTQVAVDAYLNYLEDTGQAVRHDVADFRIVYDLMGSVLIRNFSLFSPYVYRTRNVQPRVWEAAQELAEKCKERAIKKGDNFEELLPGDVTPV
ncbi:hypothetical protein IAD21_06022 [Abditibacteriota bacterium]|nr:hypothetical protein IAD21_06022 [Abditibacteriota bacterium]